MNTHIAGFQSFSAFLHHFVLAKLAASSIRVIMICEKPVPEHSEVSSTVEKMLYISMCQFMCMPLV